MMTAAWLFQICFITEISIMIKKTGGGGGQLNLNLQTKHYLYLYS